MDNIGGDFNSEPEKKDKKPRLVDLDLMRTLEAKGFKPKNPINAPLDQKIKIIRPKKIKKKKQRPYTQPYEEMKDQPKVTYFSNIFSRDQKKEKPLTLPPLPPLPPKKEIEQIIEPKSIFDTFGKKEFKESLFEKPTWKQTPPVLTQKPQVPQVNKPQELSSKVQTPIIKAFPHIPEAIPVNPPKELTKKNENKVEAKPKSIELPKLEIKEEPKKAPKQESKDQGFKAIDNSPTEVKTELRTDADSPLPDMISIVPLKKKEEKKQGLFSRMFGLADDPDELEPITIVTSNTKYNQPVYDDKKESQEKK